jgi:hypothetical protein
MKVLCMHCKKQYAEKKGDGVSHGVCDPCLEKHYPCEGSQESRARKQENAA